LARGIGTIALRPVAGTLVEEMTDSLEGLFGVSDEALCANVDAGRGISSLAPWPLTAGTVT